MRNTVFLTRCVGVILILWTFLLAGCDNAEDVAQISCTEDRECIQGQICQDSLCIVPPDEGTCEGDGNCKSGQVCRNGVCVESQACANDLQCPYGQICENKKCVTGTRTDGDGEQIIGECNTDDHCELGYICINHFCIPDETVKCTHDEDCDPGYECEGGHCVFIGGDMEIPTDGDAEPDGMIDGDFEHKENPDKTCATNADCNDGLFCNGIEICGSNLRCVQGSPPCDDSIACTADTCDEDLNQCRHTSDHTSCNDNEPCNGPEYCDIVRGCQPGAPLNCDDGVACTEDSCKTGEGCVNAPKDESCDDQVNCTRDTCSLEKKKCLHEPDVALCTGGSACAVAACDIAQGCSYTPDNQACDDHVTCTVNQCKVDTGCEFVPRHDNCQAEYMCAPGDPLSDTTTGCKPRPSCLKDEDCDDALYCNGVETCSSEKCVAGTFVNCDDSIACTTDSCDEGQDKCLHVPQNEMCSDNDFCTGVEECSPTFGCVDGQLPNCDDGVACTRDSCDPTNGCSHEPVNSRCNDAVTCTIDTCDAVNGCQHTSDNSVCNDYVPCTVDSCDKAKGCVFTPSDAFCDDSIACTSEVCSAQFNCVYTADNSKCNDSVSCTNDVCAIGVGCQFNPDDSRCTSPKICKPDQGCVDPPQCTGDANCDDGDLCNGRERCQDGICRPGSMLNCDDGFACTTDTCQPQNGCMHTPNHSACNDSDECTGDYCDLTTGCTHIPAKDSDHDNYVDSACNGGNDCNDNDPSVNPGMGELCTDGKDNDCNGLKDAADYACMACSGGCPSGLTCCDNGCVDTNSNNSNCGYCGHACSGDETCESGVCEETTSDCQTGGLLPFPKYLALGLMAWFFFIMVLAKRREY